MKEIERLKSDINLLHKKIVFLEGIICTQYPCMREKIKFVEDNHKKIFGEN